jgi:hypothetical protein
MRKNVLDVALYSDGAFQINDLWKLPFYHFEEVLQSISDKAEKIKQANQKGNKKTF